jgi:pyruvate,water dikinase
MDQRIGAAAEVVWLHALRREDVALVGGKNSSLGEMVATLGERGIAVPPGFATTADAFRGFLAANDLGPPMREALAALEAGRAPLAKTGAAIRSLIGSGEWPAATRSAILDAYAELCHQAGEPDAPVAVRSSATAEDLPDASFAGQQETFLNVRGEAAVLDACRRCYASLYTDRAIAYRIAKGFEHERVALSVGVQRMVRSETGGSGVMFSIDTETGYPDAVLITAAWGLGETVVQGTVDPDEYQVFKPFLGAPGGAPILEKRRGAKAEKMIYASDGTMTRTVPTSKAERAAFVLSDDEIRELARHAATIEDHYGCPMDIEWARDGAGGPLFIVQARPETVRSRERAGVIRQHHVTGAGEVICRGLSVGQAAVSGPVCLIESAADIARFRDGGVLVTGTTDPDWVPIMKRAAAIVTDHGGRTSHAAIVSRELGLPAVVGTGDATHVLHEEQEVTVNCAGGSEGLVHAGRAVIEAEDVPLDALPETETKVMLNLADPSAALRWWRLPADGVGLARMEFVVANAVRVHPMALLQPERVAPGAREEIEALTAGFADPADYFVDALARGLSRIAAVCHPRPVIVRMSDFKTNEYAQLLGGRSFEPHEENPMIGWRGASRYHSEGYREGFALECRAIRRLREEMGFDNVVVMIPFCRTPEEGDEVLAVMAREGLHRGRAGLQVYVMAEIPSNVIRALEFAQRFDGFSIGSNDLTQLTLGIDRDEERLSDLFREDDPAVLWMIETLVERAHAAGAKVGFCGQAPSNDPAYAATLVRLGVDSVSVTPDSFVAVKRNVADAEAAQ